MKYKSLYGFGPVFRKNDNCLTFYIEIQIHLLMIIGYYPY